MEKGCRQGSGGCADSHQRGHGCVAGCWSYPYQKPRLSYCDGYIEYRYRPDRPFECGFYFNPFQGCREHIVSLDKVIVTWSEPGCTGTEENKQAYYNVGTIHRDENYVCGDTS